MTGFNYLATVKTIENLKIELEEENVRHKRETMRLHHLIQDLVLEMETVSSGLFQESITLAEQVIYVQGAKNRAIGEGPSAIADAVSAIAKGGALGAYKNLWTEFFGTKNYDRWTGQRSDHEYGYGPNTAVRYFRSD